MIPVTNSPSPLDSLSEKNDEYIDISYIYDGLLIAEIFSSKEEVDLVTTKAGDSHYQPFLIANLGS